MLNKCLLNELNECIVLSLNKLLEGIDGNKALVHGSLPLAEGGVPRNSMEDAAGGLRSAGGCLK